MAKFSAFRFNEEITGLGEVEVEVLTSTGTCFNVRDLEGTRLRSLSKTQALECWEKVRLELLVRGIGH